MEKYITSIKELVTQTIAGVSDIKAKAEDGDAESCFKMGMIHLLGINTSIDFKKAGNFFGNQALADNPDANRLIGFIEECKGNYSLSFEYYSKTISQNRNNNIPFINLVREGRNSITKFFKSIGLTDVVLNTIITEILDDSDKNNDDSGINAKLKFATIFGDEKSITDAIESLNKEGRYYCAKRWIEKSEANINSSIAKSVENNLIESRKKPLKLPSAVQVVNIKGNSITNNLDSFSMADLNTACENERKAFLEDWESKTYNLIKGIIKKKEDEEAALIKKEAAAEKARIKKIQEEEKERIKKIKEEERAKKAEERARKNEEERAKRKEEREKKRKRKKMMIYSGLSCIILLFYTITNIGGHSFWDGLVVVCFIAVVMLCYSLIKWIIKR